MTHMNGVAERIKSKHALVTQALSAEIGSGRYKVGDLLPSELELSAAFGVSRHTVRIAIGKLQQLGLVSSQQGFGTVVQRLKVASRYAFSFNSASELLQYATTTRVQTLDTSEISVDEELAAYLNCRPAERWWRLRTLRSDPDSGALIAYSDVYVPFAFGSVLREAARGRQPVFSLIEKRFSETIFDISQEITSVSMTLDEAAHLRLPGGSPALEITRRYLGRGSRPLEVARSVHPANFKYSMHVRLQHG